MILNHTENYSKFLNEIQRVLKDILLYHYRSNKKRYLKTNEH